MRTYQVRQPASTPSRGFTLVELLVVVLIIGILSAIAYPAYTSYVKRGNRSAAQAYMMDVAQAQQQYLLDARSYGDETVIKVAQPQRVLDNYTINIKPLPGPPPTFMITLTPKGQQVGDVELTLNNDGNKTPSDKW